MENQTQKPTENSPNYNFVIKKEKQHRHKYTTEEDFVILSEYQKAGKNLVLAAERAVKKIKGVNEDSVKARFYTMRKIGVKLSVDRDKSLVDYPDQRKKRIITRLKDEKERINLRQDIISMMFEKDAEETSEAIASVFPELNHEQKIKLIAKLLEKNKDLVTGIIEQIL